MIEAALQKMLNEGFSAKDIERLRVSAEKPEDKTLLATELDRFLHHAAVTLLPPQRAALWFQIAEAYREGGAVDPALRSYRLSVGEDPTHTNSARAWLELAHDEHKSCELVDALHARIAQLRKPGQEGQRMELHKRAAHILRDEVGDSTRAFFELIRAAKLAPKEDGLWDEAMALADDAQMHRELAAVLEDMASKQKEPQDELRFLRRVHTLAKGPLGDLALAKRVKAHAKRLSAETAPVAVKIVKSARELTRELVDLDELRTTESRLRRTGRFQELLNALSQHEIGLPAEARDERSDVVLEQAIVLSTELQDAERAFSAAERALVADANSIGAHRFLIDLCINENWFERAVTCCERFADRCHTHALDALLLACELALDCLHDEGRGQRAFENARMLDPTHPGVETFKKRFTHGQVAP